MCKHDSSQRTKSESLKKQAGPHLSDLPIWARVGASARDRGRGLNQSLRCDENNETDGMFASSLSILGVTLVTRR